MGPSEAFSFLFFDALMSTLLLPPQSPLVFPVMLVFGSYSKVTMLIIAVVGAVLGTWLNLGFGRMLRFVKREHQFFTDNEKKLLKIRAYIERYGCYGLLLCVWIPHLGALYTLILGIYRISWTRVTAFAVSGHILGGFLYFI